MLRVLSALKGVRHAFYLPDEARAAIVDIESRHPSIGPLTVCNEGVREVVKRKHVACIIKDRSFRAPPHPTVLLVNERGEVVGRELLPGEKVAGRSRRKHLLIGKDFVIFVEGASGKGARFVLPPVPFKEVEAVEGIRRVVSSSPSTLGDLFIRNSAKLQDDPSLASILIGFDLART